MKNEYKNDIIFIKKEGEVKVQYDDKKQERIDNNMFTFLGNEQEEEEEKEDGKVRKVDGDSKKKKKQADKKPTKKSS